MESALASGDQRHKECSVGFLRYGSHAVPHQQHLRQHGLLPSFPGWLPSHTAHHRLHWHRQRGPSVEGLWRVKQACTRGPEPCSRLPEGGLIALDPGTPASVHGQSPRPAAAGELPLVHSASLHENKTPACSGSARHIIGRKL